MKKLIIASMTLLMLTGIFFFVSCSQRESENGKKYSQADNASVSVDSGQALPHAPLPAPSLIQTGPTAPAAVTNVPTVNEEHPKLKKYNGDYYAAMRDPNVLNDAQFKDFVDKHGKQVPGIGYIQEVDSKGKPTGKITRFAEKPQPQGEPLTLDQYNAQTERLSALGHYGAGQAAIQERRDVAAGQETDTYTAPSYPPQSKGTYTTPSYSHRQSEDEYKYKHEDTDPNLQATPPMPNDDVNGDRRARAIRHPDGSHSYDN
jgi:hypothetical protein